MENDADFRNDRDYSYGSSLAMLFYRDNLENSILHIPFTDYKNHDNYISLSYVQQIYTPKNIDSKELIKDDRPYAGYSYLQTGLYQSNDNNLKSFIVQIGIVGPASKMNKVQEFIHNLIGSPIPQGWENQLSNELGFQLNYSEKQNYIADKILGLESNFIPEYGFELGNISTEIYTSVLFRWGWNLAKDYGVNSIDNNSYSKLPTIANNSYKKRWGFNFNFSTRANIVLRNIFLDGNSFNESHNVEKNYFTINAKYGISLSYDQFSLDYIRTYTTKEFKTQDDIHSYGSLLISYNF